MILKIQDEARKLPAQSKDGNGDGTTEFVSGVFVDASLRVYAYSRLGFFENGSREFIELPVPDGWARNEVVGLFNDEPRERADVIQNHLLLEVLHEGENSPLQPIISRAGVFEVGGQRFEGIELGGLRSCYPFAEAPQILLDFGDGTRRELVGSTALIPHDWPLDGVNRLVRARVEVDDVRGVIEGPWVEFRIGNPAVPTPAPTSELVTPVVQLGSSAAGTALQWANTGGADGFNIYRDGNYIDTVRGVTSWSLANEDGQEHRYTVVSFFDDPSIFSPQSNAVVFTRR